ncbi:MAG: exonuclease SbcCD subunit D [Lachnospiraceae bacterium]|nr:exonuclease SbcCD subunit D [Lachnospiraceae bacterium]
MKFFHLSDLHIGKQLHGFSLIEDQKYILNQILGLIKERRPDALLVAGDIYDKSAPSAEAVAVFDEFLTELAGIQDGPVVCMVSGNHDSGERLSYGSRLFAEHKIHIVGNAPGKDDPEVQKIMLADEEGEVAVYLLPFFRPSYIREIPGMEEVKSYEDAMRALVAGVELEDDVRNVLVCHQFFTSSGKEPERSDSEIINVGGQDHIDVSAVAAFDYVAAGHIHRPQNIGPGNVRYCGSPLKYSVSEAGWEKSVTEVVLGRRGDVTVEKIPLVPLHDVRKIQGTLAELTSPLVLAAADPEDYVSVVLTDEEDLYEPGQALIRAYPRLLEWRVENSRTRHEMQDVILKEEKKSVLELFGDFYEQMRGVLMNEKQAEVMEKVVRAVGGDKE